jgi:hypothetical protein
MMLYYFGGSRTVQTRIQRPAFTMVNGAALATTKVRLVIESKVLEPL